MKFLKSPGASDARPPGPPRRHSIKAELNLSGDLYVICLSDRDRQIIRAERGTST